jgi:hypothetical protein
MLTAIDCRKKFGEPTVSFESTQMELWDVPNDINLAIPTIPNKIYCNKLMKAPLEKAFRNIIEKAITQQLKTWDGCFNVRKKRGQQTMSIHSWGLALDINATWNAFGAKPSMSKELVSCFTNSGFDWGGTWSKPDGMHFQLKSI